MEFNSLIGNLSKYTICPAYRIVPNKLPFDLLQRYEQLKTEKDLIEFRERYNRFLENYEDFLVETDKRNPLELGHYFEKPQPLEAVKMRVNANQ